MEDITKVGFQSKTRWRGLVSNLWAHDLMERLKIRRKVMARECGLGDVEVGTFPSHPSTIINDNGGFWKGIA